MSSEQRIVMKSEEPDYFVDENKDSKMDSDERVGMHLDRRVKSTQGFTNNNYLHTSTRMRSLFDGCCINYFRTSECSIVPCPLSHEISSQMFETEYNDNVEDGNADQHEKHIQSQLSILHVFILNAPYPPVSLIKEAVCTFAIYKATDKIVSMSKLLTRESAQNNSDYMEFIIMELVRPLNILCRSKDNAVIEILRYICDKCITQGYCEPKILDNIMIAIQKCVPLDEKLRVFEELMLLECYIFPQTLLDNLFDYTMHKNQKWLRGNSGYFKLFASRVLKDSQEEHFFELYKRSPHFVRKLGSYLWKPVLKRIFRRKLAKFTKSTKYHSTIPLLSGPQSPCTFVPQDTSTISSSQRVEALYGDSDDDLHGDSCTRRVDVQCNGDSMINHDVKKAFVLSASNEGAYGSTSQFGLRPDDLRKTSLSQQSLDNFELDVFAIQQYLNTSDFHSLLNILEKWENGQYFSDLTRRVYNVLTRMDTAEEYKSLKSLEGLLTAARHSGKLSMDMKRIISSISMNLLLDLTFANRWQQAYRIYKLIKKHELPYLNCQIYKDDDFSSARRILVFVELCMVNKDFEQAISLLVDHNMLAVNSGQWCLQNIEEDMIMRNELVTTLQDKIIKYDIRLAYKFLLRLMEAQENVEEPINLVKSYEQVLRILLEQSDESAAFYLFKNISSYSSLPVIFDRILCRALVVLCVNNSERNLAGLLVRKGRFIGVYPADGNLFSVTIKSNYTQQEMSVLVKGVLNAIKVQHVDRFTTTACKINSDLQFTVVKATDDKSLLPKLLLDVDTSVAGAKNRLISLLHLELDRCSKNFFLAQDSVSVVVYKRVLTEFIEYHMQNKSF